jgi:uncharacterized protein YkwD
MKRFITSVVALSAVLGVSLLCDMSQAAAQDPEKPLLSRKRLELIKYRALGKVRSGRILGLTNDFRAQNGVPALRGSDVLNLVASRYAALMAEKDQLGHNIDGKDPGQRITAAGYSYTAYAENVAYNMDKTDPYSAAVEQWKNSTKGHRENMLNREYTEMGAGMAISKSGKYYFCQVFATPR